jgi:hypothetical protein
MVNVNYNLFETFIRKEGKQIFEPVGSAFKYGTRDLTEDISKHYQPDFTRSFVSPYLEKVNASKLRTSELLNFNPSRTHVARFSIEDKARQLVPEGSHLRTEWNAHYASGVEPEDVGRWDNIQIDSNNNLIKDYKAAEEMAFRLDQAGVPVKVTNESGEEILQLLSQRPKTNTNSKIK